MSLDRGGIRRIQEEKLLSLMHALDGNGFYREKLEASGTKPSNVETLRDLKDVPFTTKSELADEQERHPPFGRLLTFAPNRYRRLHRTSGTSGRPLLWLDTEEDWKTWMRCWDEVYRGAGVTEDDVVFLAFSFGPYVSHWSAMEGATRTGALCVSGGGQSSLQRLQSILEHRCTVLLSTPTYALHLAEVASANGIALAGSSVRATIHAGEPGASVPNVRRRIEEAWGARAFDHTGATEVGAWGFDCLEEDHAIHLNEREFIFEVLDPDGGREVPDGERGELVITNLGRHGMPVLRYRTGDLVVRVSDPCGCGRAFARIDGGVLGRADDMLIVRGVNLYPSAIDDAVRSCSGIVEYEVEIRNREGMDDLLVKVETGSEARYEGVERELVDAFRSRFQIRVAIERAPEGSLPRYELKARRYKRI
jgi:phenylacetate-CoA ligase